MLQRCGRCWKWIHLYVFFSFLLSSIFMDLTVNNGEGRIARNHWNGETFEVLFLWICAVLCNFFFSSHSLPSTWWIKMRILPWFPTFGYVIKRRICFDPNFPTKFVDNGEKMKIANHFDVMNERFFVFLFLSLSNFLEIQPNRLVKIHQIRQPKTFYRGWSEFC